MPMTRPVPVQNKSLDQHQLGPDIENAHLMQLAGVAGAVFSESEPLSTSPTPDTAESDVDLREMRLIVLNYLGPR